MRTRQATAIAAIAAIAVIAAGCGGTSRLSKSAYEQKLKAAGTQLQADFRGVDLAPGQNLKALATKVGSLQGKLQRTADDIDKLEPPKSAEADNHKIADTLHKFADVFGQIKQAAQTGDKSKVQQLVGKLQTAGQEGNVATNDLKRKGYDVGAFGSG